MSGKWESRERNHKKVALVISVLLHIAVFTVLCTSIGSHSIKDYLHNVLSPDQQETAQVDAKV